MAALRESVHGPFHHLLSQIIAAFFTSLVVTLFLSLYSASSDMAAVIFIPIMIIMMLVGLPVSSFLQWVIRKKLSKCGENISWSIYVAAGAFIGIIVILFNGSTDYGLYILYLTSGCAGLYYVLLRVTTAVRSS